MKRLVKLVMMFSLCLMVLAGCGQPKDAETVIKDALANNDGSEIVEIYDEATDQEDINKIEELLIENFNNERVEIAKKYNISVAQLCIKWCLEHNVLPLPKSKEGDKMIENLDINNFVINNEDMIFLDKFQNLGCSGLDSDTITLFN